MSRRLTASAPGKLILIGEHAAVYGRPAVVAAVGLRVHARFAPGGDPGVTIELPTYDSRQRIAWGDVIARTAAARRAWRHYAEEPTVERFTALGGGDPGSVVVTALGEALTRAEVADPPPLELRVDSEIPAGSGFGSSASVAVSVAAGLFAWLGQKPDADRVAAAAMSCERRQHGFPSGIDHSTVLHGGVLAVRPGRRELVARTASVDRDWLARIRIFDSGRPQESTGEVVAAVRQRRGRDRRGFEERLDRMESLVASLEAAMGAAAASPAQDETPKILRAYEACLESLGVVPPPVRDQLSRLALAGYGAKISGAGALGGSGAGCVLVYDPGVEGASPSTLLQSAAEIPAPLGAPGLTLESE